MGLFGRRITGGYVWLLAKTFYDEQTDNFTVVGKRGKDLASDWIESHKDDGNKYRKFPFLYGYNVYKRGGKI